jgi:4-amino-4-deoxy-L-arabinose transferase-like glycosyltransferase
LTETLSPTAISVGDPTPDVALPTENGLGRVPIAVWIGIGLAIAAGIGLRVFVLTHSLGNLDADEATTGLVARHFLSNGEHPVFYWSSNYGGTIEAAVTAAAFVVFGSSVLVLKTVSIAWYAAACILAWRVGRRLIDERAGIAAALLMWVWPAPYVWWSTKSRGFYCSALFFGLVMALCALRLAENPKRRYDWLIFGFAFGLGWWDTPQIVLLAVPVGLWLLMRNWRAITSAWLAIPTFLLGAFPWLLWNLRHHFDSFKPDPAWKGDTYTGLLARFWRDALPVALGARVPYVLRWMVPEGNRVYALGLVAGLAGLAWGTWRLHRKGAALLLVAFAVYPFLYALNPLAFITSEARYVFMLSPVIAFTVVFAFKRTWAIAGLLTVAVALTAGGLSTMHDGESPIPSDKPVPLHLGPLVRALDEEGRHTAFTTYWIAYRLDFETTERITAVGAPYNRYPPYDEKVRADPAPPAWIFVAGSAADQHFRAKIDSLGEPYKLRVDGGFAIYLPEHKLLPGQVPSE